MGNVVTDLTDVFFACRAHMKLRIRISEDVEEVIKCTIRMALQV